MNDMVGMDIRGTQIKTVLMNAEDQLLKQVTRIAGTACDAHVQGTTRLKQDIGA